jgi:hypothetical protein
LDVRNKKALAGLCKSHCHLSYHDPQSNQCSSLKKAESD